MPTKQQHSTAMKEKEMISFKEKENVTEGSQIMRYEKERLRNTFTFLTSNLFLLEPEEVDGTVGESTSIPSGSAIFLLC